MAMKKLIKHMFSEYDDFMEYMKMHEECSDPTTKTELRKIAEEEMHHYKHIYDLVFPKPGTPGAEAHTWTPIEKGVYDYASALYHQMADIFSQVK